MKHFSYSVAIRTLGNTGEKYQHLLKSIQSQTIQPEEIIVAIPEGYELDYSIGTERIVRCPKGMTSQRATSIVAVQSEYMLVVDDDVEFDADMVQNLYDYMTTNNLDCCLPMSGKIEDPSVTTINLAYPLSIRLRGGFTGQMLTSHRNSPYLDVLTYTAGHKVFVRSNNLDTCYLCTTACFQCFFIKTSIAKSAHFEDELWLDEGKYKYASFDEPVFFSKLNLQNFRMAYALRVRYTHLDAKVGHITRTKLEDKCIRYYTIGRNRTIYWYKCIYLPNKTFWKRLCIVICGLYAFINYNLWTISININPKNWKAIKDLVRGYKDAYRFCKSLTKH